MAENNQPTGNALQLDKHMKVETGGVVGKEWHSPLESPFRVSGLAWWDLEYQYRRLPVEPNEKIPSAVDDLANCTAGGQIRFQTDSPSVAVRMRLKAKAGMYHMPATGEGGVDAYIGEAGALLYAGTARFLPSQQEYESELFAGESGGLRQFTLNLPLYQGVETVWIGLEPGARILPPKAYESEKRIVLYGTSIGQGGCASRPGMAYTNILSRRINYEFINLGFSGNGKGEPELARLISQIEDPALLVLDYEGNSGSTESYRQTLPEFIRILRETHPEAPILVISRVPYGLEPLKPELLRSRLERLTFQREHVQQLQEQGDRRLFFFDGSTLLGADPAEATVDGVHPTDMGFLRMADGLEPVLRRILADS